MDVSFYPTAVTPPVNPLQTFGQYQGIANAMQQNQILQQQAQQAKNATVFSNAQTKIRQMMGDPQYMTPAGLNTNALASAAAKDSVAAPGVADFLQNVAMPLNAATASGAVDASGRPILSAAQSVAGKYSPGGNTQPQMSTTPTQNPQVPAPQPANLNQPQAAPVNLTAPSGQVNPDAGLPQGASAQASGVPPGFAENVQASTTNATNLFDKVATSSDRIAALRQAKEALAHTTGTGPKSDYINNMKSALAYASPAFASQVAGIDPNSINAYDEVNKLLLQYASTQPGASGSDLRTMNSMASNPNVHMQPGAINTIINSLLGREMKNQVIAQEWSDQLKKGASPGGFNQFMIPLANLDSRAFNMEDRTPEEAHNLVQDVRASGQTANFNTALGLARKHNHSPAPQQGQ